VSTLNTDGFGLSGQERIPIRRQCELPDLPPSSCYCSSDRDNSFNELLMKLIDEKYTKAPLYGFPRMSVWLRLAQPPFLQPSFL